MNLHEYQARDILQRYGIPVTGGGVASAPEEVAKLAESAGGKVAVKAQVLVGGGLEICASLRAQRLRTGRDPAGGPTGFPDDAASHANSIRRVRRQGAASSGTLDRA